MLTAERARELLDYEPETGVFRWKVSPARNVLIGSVAGYVNIYGYRTIMFERRNYKAHRLAWLHFHGEWPPDQIDHKDTGRDHNWIDNLRIATSAQNKANARLRARNKCGLKGVSYKHKKWRAVIKKQHLGMFDTPELAHAAYCDAARQLFGQFARGE